jgi:hypothetical protein
MRTHEELIATPGFQAIGRDWINPAFRARFGYPDSLAEAGRKILDGTITQDELLEAQTQINQILDNLLGGEE